jgi:GTP-binding protein HflX
VDTAHPERERQMRAVSEVLAELGAGDKPIITAFNKADMIKDTYVLQELITETPNSCYLSALKRDGIPFLMDRMEVTLQSLLATVTLALPYDRSDIVAQCYEMGRVHSVDYGSETITVHADIAKELAGRLVRFTPDYVAD